MTAKSAIQPLLDDLAGASWQPHELTVLSGGTPRFARNVQFTSDDGLLVVGIWESEPGVLKLSDYPVAEYCKILTGQLRIRSADGAVTEHGPGSAFVIPPGFNGEWEMLTRLRKEFVVRRPAPAMAA